MISDGLLIGPNKDINEEEWLKKIISDIDTGTHRDGRSYIKAVMMATIIMSKMI